MKPFKDTYVMYQLLEFIDESSIICLCKATNQLNEICKQYIELESDKRFEVIVDDDLFENYCEKNNVIKIRKMIEIGLDWDSGLYYACKGGHIEIIKLMIKKGATRLDRGLYGACEGGHLDIVKLMIEKGAHNWNWGLVYACRGGYIDIVKLMIKKGTIVWNWGFEDACEYGHMDICKFLIEKGATECWNCNKSMEEHLSKK